MLRPDRKEGAWLRFLLDASVPVSVGEALSKAGHTTIYHGEVLAEGAKDPLVCLTALQNDAILVAVDKDMKQLTKRFGVTDERFKNLSLLFCGCSLPTASKRITQAMSLIEHEWAHAEEKVGRRLWIEISNHYICTFR